MLAVDVLADIPVGAPRRNQGRGIIPLAIYADDRQNIAMFETAPDMNLSSQTLGQSAIGG